MKRKFVALMLGITMTTSMLAGCQSSDNAEYKDVTIFGEVEEVGEKTITVTVERQMEQQGDVSGERKGRDNSEDTSEQQKESSDETKTQQTEVSADAKDEQTESTDETAVQEQEAKSDAKDSGEDQTKEKQERNSTDIDEAEAKTCKFEVDDDTEIVRQTMGGGMQMQKGNGKMEMPEGAADGEKPEMPEGAADGEKPEMPEGAADGEKPEMPEGAADGEKPEMPEGAADGEQTEMPEGMTGKGNGFAGDRTENQEEIELSDIEEGDQVVITFDEEGDIEKIVVMSMNGGMQQASGVDSYNAVNEYTEDAKVEGETITSTGTDENAIHVLNGAETTFSSVTVEKESSDSTGGDNSSFYGVGAAILTTEGTSYIKDSTIDTDSAGGAGIFSYGDGVTYVSGTKITTKQDTSGGIHVAGGGTLYAWDLDVETDGESSAAIRSDRGSGTMVVDGGTYTSNGVGSPAVYSTANIAVKNADLTANGSEAACIEGLNSIYLYDSDLSGNMAEDEQNDCTWNVILYQSMSGDSEVGNSTFQMEGGSLTAKNGGMFYTTNTESTFVLSDVDITYAENSPFFLKCTGNKNQRGWGQTGSNGADCHFTAINQTMKGDIIWDSISQLDFYMTEGSTLKGAAVQDESCAGEGGEGYCNFYIAKGCTWTVTEDSVITNLVCAGNIVDSDGDSVNIVDTDGNILVEGDSNITVTVESYQEKNDVSGATAITDWSEFEVEKPEK